MPPRRPPVDPGIYARLVQRINELERRLDALQQGQPGRSEAYQPNYLTFDPASGRIGAQFTGRIKALGVDIDAGLSDVPDQQREVRWVRQDGTLVAEVYAYTAGGGDFLELFTEPGVDGTVKLQAQSTLLSLQDTVARSSIDLIVPGTPGRTLLDNVNNSSWVQVHVASASQEIAFKWTGTALEVYVNGGLYITI